MTTDDEMNDHRTNVESDPSDIEEKLMQAVADAASIYNCLKDSGRDGYQIYLTLVAALAGHCTINIKDHDKSVVIATLKPELFELYGDLMKEVYSPFETKEEVR